jgi:hypothetical protein
LYWNGTLISEAIGFESFLASSSLLDWACADAVIDVRKTAQLKSLRERRTVMLLPGP